MTSSEGQSGETESCFITLNQYTQYSQSVSAPSSLAEFLGTDESPVVIRDPQLEKRGKAERAQLRSVPFLMELGIGQFLYDDLWSRDFQLVEHDHLDPTAVTVSDLRPPLAHLVTGHQLLPRHEQELGYEGISQADLAWKLLQKASEDKTLGQHVLVTDTESPQIPSRTPVVGRSATDHFDAVPFDYEQLIKEYIESYVESKLPLEYTKNLYFHRVSEHHARNGVPAATISELFDYTKAPPGSPVWRPLYYFIEHELQEVHEEYEAHVTEALRSWIEHGDTGKIAKSMIAVLHAQEYDAERVAEYQNTTDR